MSFLDGLVRSRFPDAQVTRLEDRDAYRVTVIIPERDVVMSRLDREQFARSTLKKLEPVVRRNRRLHWGKKH